MCGFCREWWADAIGLVPREEGEEQEEPEDDDIGEMLLAESTMKWLAEPFTLYLL